MWQVKLPIVSAVNWWSKLRLMRAAVALQIHIAPVNLLLGSEENSCSRHGARDAPAIILG